MTTLLAPPLVVVRSVEPCNGQCGGEVTLYTDLLRSAYAVTNTFGETRYMSGDTDLILRKDSGDIEVSCQAVNLGDEVCDGVVVFTHHDLTQTSEWLEPTRDVLGWLSPMDRE